MPLPHDLSLFLSRKEDMDPPLPPLHTADVTYSAKGWVSRHPLFPSLQGPHASQTADHYPTDPCMGG